MVKYDEWQVLVALTRIIMRYEVRSFASVHGIDDGPKRMQYYLMIV